MKYLLYILMFIFATNLDIYMFNQEIFPYRPAHFFIPAFVVIAVISFNIKDYPAVMKTHTFRFLLLFALLSAIFATTGYSSSDTVLTALTNSAITLLLYFFSVFVFWKTRINAARMFFLVSVVVLALSLWYDLFVGLDKLNDEIRKGGFATNPNLTASALKFMGLCLFLMYRNNKRMRTILLLILVSSIFITFSRSGIVGIAICVLLLLMNEWRHHFNLKLRNSVFTFFRGAVVLVIAYILLLNLADIIKKEIPEFTEGEAGKRIELLLGRQSQSAMVTDDRREKGRAGLALAYFKHFMEKPLGSGTGFTAEKNINTKDTHNIYLKAAVEFGIFGLAILLVYYFYSFRISIKRNNFYYFVLFMMLFFEGFISHAIFVEKPILIALAFMDSNLYFNKDIIET